MYNVYEAIRGAAARNVTVKPTGSGFDPHSKRLMKKIVERMIFFRHVLTASREKNNHTKNNIDFCNCFLTMLQSTLHFKKK